MKQHFYQHALLPMLEVRQANQSAACYQAHSHNEFSFGVVDQGCAVYQNLSKRHDIAKGDAVFINPSDVHACNPQQGPWSYRMLFLDPDWLANLQHECGLSLALDFHAFKQAVDRDESGYRHFNQLFAVLTRTTCVLEAEAQLVEYLMPLFNLDQHESRVSDQLYRAKERLLDQVDGAPSLTELADEVGISRYHLLRSFKGAFGLAPHAYLLDAKIKLAKQRLKAGNPILDTALALGFSDQSHFQHQFKKRIAMTPKQYQLCFR